ncbi:MAG: HlyD family efflux transporter periplasmic adaptor subunit [candidate division KSB1 bacterium]|nr:HlyD family efflux transporter periplasmic adaptor subunit [candidate division KSB1 bacterium]MDZ7341313.1 HlyD family efflux transporter periplasmic adaptor subunit [candidate division KSB1 bacterium]
MELEFSIDKKNYSLSIQKKNEHYQVKIGDQIIELQAEQVTPNCLLLKEAQGHRRIYLANSGKKTFIHLDGRSLVVEHPETKEKTSFQADEHLAGADHGIYAPMPGKILKIFVQENQTVTAKQNLVIVEAMKMEHSVRAPRKGVVKKVNFKEGELVDTGQEILEIEFEAENNNGQ